MKFAVIKSAGLNVGKVRSVHRGFGTAFKACPATFHTVRQVPATTKPGAMVKVK